MSACRLGVLAFGDSITNGGGELQWGVALQSWALWVARGLGAAVHRRTPPTARGSRTCSARRSRPSARTARGDRYDLGCLYAGVNDVRALDWDRAAFAARPHARRWRSCAERCDRVLTVTVPLDLGRPRAGARVEEANAAIEASARAAGALVLDLRGFGARNLVMADHVHPTAFGQIAIAERALDVLAADGLPPRVRPSTLIRYETHAARAPARRPHVRVPAREGVGARCAQRCSGGLGSSTPSCLKRHGT